MVWLPDSKKIKDMSIRYNRIRERDGQTDRQTDGRMDGWIDEHTDRHRTTA